MPDSSASSHAKHTHRLFLGTSSGGNGIFVSDFDSSTGALSEPKLSAQLPKANFLCFDGKNLRKLLSCNQPQGRGPGEVVCLTVNDSGEELLTPHNRVSTEGNSPVYVSARGHAVVAANYSSGSAVSFRLDDDGTLHKVTLVRFDDAQHGPNPKRQTQSYAHAATISPDGGYVLVNDLGLDQIHILRLNPETAELTEHGTWHALPGSGPRHIVLHPNGRWIYNVNEMGCSIDQLDWNKESGTLTALRSVDTLPPDTPKNNVRACEMVISADKRFLYASNRVHESFTVYQLDGRTGGLTPVHYFDNPGKESRHIALDPTGHWFVSANQFSNEISVFPLNTKTGEIGERVSTTPLDAPSCVLFD